MKDYLANIFKEIDSNPFLPNHITSGLMMCGWPREQTKLGLKTKVLEDYLHRKYGTNWK